MEDDYVDTITKLFASGSNALGQNIDDSISGYMQACDGLRKAGPDMRDLNSVAHVALRVDIRPASERPDGNLAEDVPNILIKQLLRHGDGHIHLTWEEARMLCAALWQVTNVAEFG